MWSLAAILDFHFFSEKSETKLIPGKSLIAKILFSTGIHGQTCNQWKTTILLLFHDFYWRKKTKCLPIGGNGQNAKNVKIRHRSKSCHHHCHALSGEGDWRLLRLFVGLSGTSGSLSESVKTKLWGGGTTQPPLAGRTCMCARVGLPAIKSFS